MGPSVLLRCPDADAVDWYFLGLDWMGAFISLMALGELFANTELHHRFNDSNPVAQNTFDYLGGVLYIVV